MIKTTFVMEQHIGHFSYYQNLRRFIDRETEIAATWVPVTYHRPDSMWGRLPLVPGFVRGTMMGRQQVHEGLLTTPYDVAVFNTQVPAILGRKWVNRPYVICTDITPIQYDLMGEHYEHEPDRNALLKAYKYQANRRMFQGAARILPWSNWVKTSLINDYGVNPHNIEVVPPSVDINVWQPDLSQRTDKVRILFVGGDFYRKGGQLLLDSFRALPEGSNAELHLVTRTPLEDEAGVVVYNGMQANSAELIQLYQSSDIFVLPTQAEAFGIVALEASAVGMPVIGTRVGGLPDAILEDESGYLIESGDGQALTQYLSCLIESKPKRRQMGMNARKHVENNFDAHKNAQRVSDILQEVMGKK